MLLIWIAMLVAGLWALVTGKLPMVLFSGLGTHQVEGTAARVIGLSLALSAPVSFIGLLILSLLFENNNPAYSLMFGLTPTLLVMVGATFAVRGLRTPYQLTGDTGNLLAFQAVASDTAVRQQVQRSMYLMALGLGLTLVAHPVAGVILFPLAYLQATRALSPTEVTGIKDRYHAEANLIRLLSVILVVVSVLFACGVIA